MSSSQFRLDQDFECDGIWWLPATSLHRVPGKLKFSIENGLKVECGTTLIARRGLQITPPQTIFGEISGGQRATLFDATGSLNLIAYGSPTQLLTGSGLFVGDHVESLDATIDKFSLSIDGLDEWISDGPFGPKFEGMETDEHGDIQFNYSLEDEADEVYRVESLSAEISFDFWCDRIGGGHSISLKQGYLASVTPQQPIAIRDAIRVSHDLELLFTLLTGAPTFIETFNFGEWRSGYTPSQHLVYHRIRHANRKRFGHRMWMPANFGLLTSKLSTVLDRWFTMCESYRPIFGLLRAVLFQSEQQSVESHFLSLAQAVEGYCRIKAQEKYFGPDEFHAYAEAMRATIPPGCSPHVRDILNSKIGFLNDFTLKDRLKSQFTQNPWLPSALWSDLTPEEAVVKSQTFVRDVGNARNKLTHLESSKGDGLKFSSAMIWELRLMLCLLLLSDIGVDVNKRLLDCKEIMPVMWWMDLPKL